MLTAALARGAGRLGGHLLDLLVRARVTPNAVTVAGTIVSVAAAALFAGGRLGAAGLAVLGAAAFDLLDGALARRTGRRTRFGEFLDSTLDRYSDGALIAGIMVHFARTGRTTFCALAGVALLGAFVTSYARARAEPLTGERLDIGFWERPERIGAIATGGVLDVLPGVTLILAVFGNVTALKRILWVRHYLAEPGTRAAAPPPWILRLGFPRYGLLYDLILLGALVFLLVFRL